MNRTPCWLVKIVLQPSERWREASRCDFTWEASLFVWTRKTLESLSHVLSLSQLLWLLHSSSSSPGWRFLIGDDTETCPVLLRSLLLHNENKSNTSSGLRRQAAMREGESLLLHLLKSIFTNQPSCDGSYPIIFLPSAFLRRCFLLYFWCLTVWLLITPSTFMCWRSFCWKRYYCEEKRRTPSRWGKWRSCCGRAEWTSSSCDNALTVNCSGRCHRPAATVVLTCSDAPGRTTAPTSTTNTAPVRTTTNNSCFYMITVLLTLNVCYGPNSDSY